ncbi:glycosyltransferase [Candidatus Woesearchaeota archaeon]|nr:glycosyltransferase [Candidatus Woesearchaeota archaeon]
MLSLCMIVKDESGWLKDALAAAKPFVDELIVVDTGSSDDSIAIAEAAGAVVHRTPWEHDYAKAKNLALEHATQEWILVLDADERITADDFANLREFLKTTTADAVKLEIRNYVKEAGFGCISCTPSEITKGSVAYRSIKLARVFRNKGYRYANRVHEMIELSVEAAKGTIAEAPFVIHHYGILFATNLKHKLRYYGWLVFKELAEHPDNVRALFLAGQFCQERKQLDRALEYYHHAAKIDPNYKNVWFSIANVHLEQRNNERAMHAYEQSLIHNPDSPNAPQAVNNLAVLYANANRKDDAKKILSAGLRRFPTNAVLKKNAERFMVLA